MAVLKKYDFEGKETGEITIEDALLDVGANSQMMKDYIVAIRKNQRQWSANTKTRIEVNKTKAKCQKQKGLGRARHGNLAAVQFRGGGVVFGPKPKFDQHVRINKKERRATIKFLLAEKIKKNRVHVLQIEENQIEKTKQVAYLFRQMKMSKRILILAEGKEKRERKEEKVEMFRRNMKNLPFTSFTYFPFVNGYDLMLCQDIILFDGAAEELKAMFLEGKNGKRSV